MTSRRTLLLFITEDWYVASHRLPLIRAARGAGWRVVVATRVGEHAAVLQAAGAEVVPLRLTRASRHPWRELVAVAEFARVVGRERPAALHTVGLKPILYGAVVAAWYRVPVVVHAFAGMGHLFTGPAEPGPLRRLVEVALRALLRRPGTVVLVQNGADAALLADHGLAPRERIRLVPGAGVDLQRFGVTPEPEGVPPLVVVPARLLRDKGIAEFVTAAGLLRRDGVTARFALVGDTDPANPGSLADATLETWRRDGVVECWGPRRDMPAVLAQAALVVLPSWREGMPKALLEAAACGRAIVTTDVPGCRDVVQHEWNGLLVPVGDAVALAAAIRRLLEEPATRARFGRRGRERAERDFGDVALAERVVALYGRTG